MADKDIYLQSPIDDLESFFHVFVWAVMHNEDSQGALFPHEQKYKDQLSGPVQSRGDTQIDILANPPGAAIVEQLQNVMKAWDGTQRELQWKYNFIVGKYPQLVAKKLIGQGGTPEQAFWKWAWNLIAYEGVQRIVEIIYSRRELLTTYSSFKQE